MKNDNPKYIIALVLIILLFVGIYIWDKYKKAAGIIAANAAAIPGTAATPVSIAANTIAGAVRDNYYPYGNGKIYFEDRDPSTYKTAELLSFTPDMAARSAFKSLN